MDAGGMICVWANPAAGIIITTTAIHQELFIR
jgi:hypothetical protein